LKWNVVIGIFIWENRNILSYPWFKRSALQNADFAQSRTTSYQIACQKTAIRILIYFIPFANDIGMFGLSGLTLTRCLAGSTIKSMSSIGIAPSST
jgi:hypothetical protein